MFEVLSTSREDLSRKNKLGWAGLTRWAQPTKPVIGSHF
jgi:hypothetical protein